MAEFHLFSKTYKTRWLQYDVPSRAEHHLGALTGTLLLTTGLFTTYINADIFCAWLTPDLLPTLRPRCVLVMDNATFHKRQDILTAIAGAGYALLFLPPYSPGLNPIAHQWAQATTLRKKDHSSIETLYASSAR